MLFAQVARQQRDRLRPPCNSNTHRTTVRPIPKPPPWRASELSTCVNRLKMEPGRSGARSIPLSRTLKSALLPARVSLSWIRPRAGVYSGAFSNRFVMICSSQIGSQSTSMGASEIPLEEDCLKRMHAMARGEIWGAGKYKEKDGDILERSTDGRERITSSPFRLAKLQRRWQS